MNHLDTGKSWSERNIPEEPFFCLIFLGIGLVGGLILGVLL